MRRLIIKVAFCRPGSDLLSRVLRRSTMGAGAFHGRVRKGNGCSHPAITTRSAKRNFCNEKLVDVFTSFLFEHVFKHHRSGQPLCGCRGMSIVNENDQADRAISTGKLHALPHFHTRPINVVVFHGSDREHSFSGGFPA